MIHQAITDGTFTTEPEAWEFFDRILEKCDAFKVYREVCGEYVQARPYSEDKDARIDRILVPRQRAIDAGWHYGPFGIEGKKSGTKAGRAISQAMDYSRCVFELNHGFLTLLRWVFIWPLQNPKHDLESVMCQNRIGCVTHWRDELTFGCGGTNAIVIHADGSVDVKLPPMGNKRGSR